MMQATCLLRNKSDPTASNIAENKILRVDSTLKIFSRSFVKDGNLQKKLEA